MRQPDLRHFPPESTLPDQRLHVPQIIPLLSSFNPNLRTVTARVSRFGNRADQEPVKSISDRLSG